MAAEIYKHPEHITYNQIPFTKQEGSMSWVEKQKIEDEKFEKELRKWCQEQSPKNKNVGEVIRIPHADSTADYMVYKMRPLSLIVLPFGDAWHSPMADLLTPTRVVEMIEANKKLNEKTI
jgi:hypothetical protein